MFSMIIIIITPLLLAGVICLQVFLSKRSNKWLGLILPIISFVISIYTIFNIYISDYMNGWQIFASLASTFAISIIPTVILLAIYFACRGKMKNEDELQKMNIQDL